MRLENSNALRGGYFKTGNHLPFMPRLGFSSFFVKKTRIGVGPLCRSWGQNRRVCISSFFLGRWRLLSGQEPLALKKSRLEALSALRSIIGCFLWGCAKM